MISNMKWLHDLFSRKRRERLCRVRDFVVLAWTGKGLGADELAFLRKLMTRYRFDADLLNVISQAPDRVADAYPAAAEERALHLVRMVRFALHHDKKNARARAYCRLTARKMGLPEGTSQAAAARLTARPDTDDRSLARRLLHAPQPPDGEGGKPLKNKQFPRKQQRPARKDNVLRAGLCFRLWLRRGYMPGCRRMGSSYCSCNLRSSLRRRLVTFSVPGCPYRLWSSCGSFCKS